MSSSTSSVVPALADCTPARQSPCSVVSTTQPAGCLRKVLFATGKSLAMYTSHPIPVRGYVAAYDDSCSHIADKCGFRDRAAEPARTQHDGLLTSRTAAACKEMTRELLTAFLPRA